MRKSHIMSRVRLAALLGAGALAASFAVAGGTTRVLAGAPVTLYVNGSAGTSTTCTSPGAGACPTVQDGINAAESYVASDVTVMIAAGTYDEGDTATVPGGDTLTLDGAGAATTTINGGGVFTVLEISSGTATIEGLTMTNGYAPIGGGVDIESDAVVSMMNDTISYNAAQGEGAGIGDFGGATLVNDTISNNTISDYGQGAGVFVGDGSTTATLTDDTISGNSVGYSGQGAGLTNQFSSAVLTDDTISGNTSGVYGEGGGIYDTGTITLTNDTMWNNSTGTGGSGGGIYLGSNGTFFGVVTLTDDTLAQDSASTGGGIANQNGGTANVANSIVDAATCAGPVVDQGYNVEDDNSCFGTDSQSVENSTTINLATSLAPNGSTGPETLAIGPSSSAFEEVPLANCTVTTDERGDTRPGVPGANCDAGAYEYQQPATGSPITEIATQAATCTQFAHNIAHTQSSVTYALKNGKVKSVTPASFTYWVRVTSSGGSQTLAVTESASETSRLFLVSASGSSAYTSTCAAVPITLTQSGGSITVKFNGGTAGAIDYIELKVSTSAVVGEVKPAPSATVTYTFSAPSSGGGPRKISLES
jgi:hypothetical protein